MVQRACLLVLALAGLYACSEECAVQACDEASKAQPSGSLETGIAGVASYRTDACSNDCCECEYTSSTLLVFEVDEPIASGEDPEERLGSEQPLRTIEIDERYAQELAAGRYAVCDQPRRTCANVELAAGQVFTVNVQTRFGPTSLRVFDDAGAQHRDWVVGDGAPY